jgi:hypothetical protein
MAFDFGIYYAQGHSKLPACGWMSANHFARIGDVQAMAPVIGHEMLHGTQRVIVRRGRA